MIPLLSERLRLVTYKRSIGVTMSFLPLVYAPPMPYECPFLTIANHPLVSPAP
jgi:hypothetical protein